MKYRNEKRYHTRRLVEIELKNFLETLKEVNARRDAVINGTSGQEAGVCVQSGTTSNSTQNKALSLCDIEFMEMDRKIRAIEVGLRVLKSQEDKDYHSIIIMKYFEKKFTDFGIMEALHLSKSNYWRKNYKSVSVIAQYLGWKV